MAYCELDDVKARFRLGESDTLDDAWIQDCIDATAGLIDQALDRIDDAADLDADWQVTLLKIANTNAAIEMLRRPPFGIVDGWSDVGPVRVSSDPLAGVRGLLIPLKDDESQWGFA